MWFCPVCGDLRKLRACCTQVVRTLRASCSAVIFEQNMPESSQSDGRLVDRKHTLRPRNEILSLGVCVVVGDASLGRASLGGRLWEGEG